MSQAMGALTEKIIAIFEKNHITDWEIVDKPEPFHPHVSGVVVVRTTKLCKKALDELNKLFEQAFTAPFAPPKIHWERLEKK